MGAFPDAATTGPAAGGYTPLTPQTAANLPATGPYPPWVTVNGDGSLTIQSCSFTGQITVSAPNVNFIGCEFQVAGTQAISTNAASGYLNISYCQISAPDQSHQLEYCVHGNNVADITVDHCDLFWWSEALAFGGDSITVTDNYIHDPVFYTGDHTEGMYFAGGQTGITVTGNTVLNPLDQTAAVAFFQDNPGGYDGVTVSGNLMAGGDFALYAGAGGAGTVSNFVVEDNAFATIYYPDSGQFGQITDAPSWGSNGNVLAGNVTYNMAWTLVNSQMTSISTAGSQAVYSFPSGAPSAGQLDVIGFVINANTATTPAGWTAGPSAGDTDHAVSYIFYLFAADGASSSVTIPTSGSQAAVIMWARFTGGHAGDASGHAFATGTVTSTPAVSTGALAKTGELSVIFAGLQNGGALPSSPSYSANYLELAPTAQAGGESVAGLAAYYTNAGTAAETPSVSWTNAYGAGAVLVQTFTPFVAPKAAKGSSAILAVLEAADLI